MINEKETWQKCCETVRIWFKAMRRWIAAELYYLLGKCTDLVSVFYIFIAANTTEEGKIKNVVFKHAIRKACDWVGRGLVMQYRCRERIDECKELLTKLHEIQAEVDKEIHIMKEMAKCTT